MNRRHFLLASAGLIGCVSIPLVLRTISTTRIILNTNEFSTDLFGASLVTYNGTHYILNAGIIRDKYLTKLFDNCFLSQKTQHQPFEIKVFVRGKPDKIISNVWLVGEPEIGKRPWIINKIAFRSE